jgi:hypothetical protein
VEKMILSALKAHVELMVLPADKGNVIVVLTADFNQEILIPLSTKLIKSSRRT